MFKLDFEKAEEPEVELPTSVGSSKSKRVPEKICFCLTDHAKAFVCVDHNKPWKILSVMEIPDHLTCLLRHLYAGQELLEPDMEQQTASILGKEYVKAVYRHPAYLTYMQSTS